MNTEEQLASSYYDSVYYRPQIERVEKMDRFTQVRSARVLALLGHCSGQRIGDIGCGVGTMTVALARCGARPVCLDYSSESLRIAKAVSSRHCAGTSFQGACCDGVALPLHEEALDGMIAADFTEHITHAVLVGMCREVYRVLAPGGRFVIYTPCPTHLIEVLKERTPLLKQDASHIGLRPMAVYAAVLKSAGFRIAQSYFEPTHLPGLSCVEQVVMRIPGIAPLARRRICIRAEKPQERA